MAAAAATPADDDEAHANATAAAAAAAHEKESEPIEVGQTFLGVRYLRIIDVQRNRPLHDLVPILCRACERPLTHTDQLLCTRRRWGFGDSAPEPACFVNSLVRGSFRVEGSYDEQLAQGLMKMADVFCACGEQVGYKFVADRTPSGRNLNQVGAAAPIRTLPRTTPLAAGRPPKLTECGAAPPPIATSGGEVRSRAVALHHRAVPGLTHLLA